MMGTAGRSAPLRRTGSLLGLLGVELAAVLVLHWLGRFPGLRIGWGDPVPWVLSSPVQEVLGSLLRTVGLVMAYWLLASTVLYLLASLTRLPGAVRAVRWATLPLARRVADHAVAVTLATSMVGGGTLGVAGPALAAERGGGTGPPAGRPVAAAQANGSSDQDAPPSSGGDIAPSDPAYTPNPAGDAPTSSTEAPPPPPPPSAAEPPERSDHAYTPNPADQVPTTTTTEPPASTEPPRSTEAPATTEPDTTEPDTTEPDTDAPATTEPATTTTAKPPPPPPPPPPTPAYTFHPPTTTTTPSEGDQEGDTESGGETDRGEPGGKPGGETDRAEDNDHKVRPGESLWSIARAEVLKRSHGGSGEPTNRDVAEYWVKLVDKNWHRLESGDPDLIYPDEMIILPDD